jgi:hypothetical protein
MFQIGDKVKVMSGDHKGQKGTIMGTTKGRIRKKGRRFKSLTLLLNCKIKRKLVFMGNFL